MRECALGVDIGATKIAAGLVDATGQVLAHHTTSTPAGDPEAVFRSVVELIRQLSESVSSPDVRIRGLGVGTAGQVDVHTGAVRSATPNLRGWGGVPLAQRLRAELAMPVRIDNDGNVALLAEVWAGAAKGHMNAVGLTLGTGIGGGVLTHGHLLHGTWGGAGELGHVCVNFHGPRCTCGSTGCMEVYASGRGLVDRLRERLTTRPMDASAVVQAYVRHHGPEGITTALILEWAQAGDPLARETWEEALTALALGVINLIHVFNPTVVVVGGGVAAANPYLVSQLAERVSRLGMASLVESVRIEAARFGALSGVIGAAALILQPETGFSEQHGKGRLW
ncbi:ROK family protein [Alicyclobacillus herbarius]|uniref:ROK family protein n=1 Tax=Alicyclobacillus herbarius TaxID=122960 RepID=UPI000401836D|nr:ROK family protein [Alicyclobacillus herbarius]